MRIYVNDRERPLLQDVLYEALARVESELATAEQSSDLLRYRRLQAERQAILGMLTKLGEKVVA